MMRYYFVKSDLFGIKKGTIERFADHKAGQLIVAGKIEPYDEKKHGDGPGSPKAIDAIYEQQQKRYEARIAAAEEHRRTRSRRGTISK